ncbi:MAG: AAA family ATPase, partial [Chitinivibrionales bacterium]|nr:AAA family ATPase [Chitinivibrionales bacterium]MBD3356866.1 AAA family ATPase [Chitinivibrionales bacterium]
IDNPDVSHLEQRILRCTRHVSGKHGAMIIEGTGHAGVGSCFGLSNAKVAKLIGAKVVIVGSGGIGKPIDEIALNMALFERRGVEVIGIVLNKVIPRKFDEVKHYVQKGATIIGTSLLGATPHVPALTFYRMEQIAEEFGYDVVVGKEYLHNPIRHTVVLAMRPEHGVKYIRENTLVIVPCDRTDNIRIAVSTLKNYSNSNGGIILTGCATVDRKMRTLLRGSDIPVLVSPEDTFKVSSRMVHLEFKIRASDREKIDRLRKLVGEHVDVDELVNRLQ